MESSSPDITRNLAALSDPAQHAVAMQQVYQDLLRIARAELSRHRRGETLNTRALVNEAYLKLFGSAGSDFDSRRHFFATAARAMHQVVIDHARAKQAQSRGSGAACLSFDDIDPNQMQVEAQAESLLRVDVALGRLAKLDPRLAEVIELRFFAGLEVSEVAQLLDVSEPTIKRDTRTAKAFLTKELGA